MSKYGIVQHAKSGEFFAAEFASEPDQFGTYHILRAAGPIEHRTVIDEDNRLVDGWEAIAEQAIANNDEAEDDGKWLDGEPGDLW